MDKRILVIDDNDQRAELENLRFDAGRKGINLYYEQFNVGGRLEPKLLNADGSINYDETVKEFKRRFTNKKFCLIVCDWELGSPQKDGVELLKRLGNTCHIKETDRLMYSGKLDIKLHDKLTEYKENKITDDVLIAYIKGLVVARFIDFVDRNDLEKTVLQYLQEVETVDHIVLETLMGNADMVFDTSHDHKLKGRNFGEVAQIIENDPKVMTDLKRDLVKEVLFYLTQKQTKRE